MLQVIIHEKKLYHCIHKDSELQSSRGGLVVELWTDTDTFLITRIIGIQDCLHVYALLYKQKKQLYTT